MTDVRPINALASVPVGAIQAHPGNVRERLGDLDDLVASIREVGILQPLTVERLHDGRYQVLAGHRRLAAARKAGLTHVPCVLRRDQLPDEAIVLMLIENCQRRSLDPIEEARALQKVLDSGGVIRPAELAPAPEPTAPGEGDAEPGGNPAAPDDLQERLDRLYAGALRDHEGCRCPIGLAIRADYAAVMDVLHRNGMVP